MHGGLPQFPGVLGPHLARGVRPWLPQLLPSVEDLFGCRVSIHEGGIVSNMASRKKDGGAARAEGRKRVQNKRTEAKYGLQGFTKQAEANLRAPGRYIPTARQSGMGIIEASGFGNAVSVGRAAARLTSSAPVRGLVRSVGRVVKGALGPKTYYGVHGSATTGLRQITPRIGSSSAATNRAVAGTYGKAAVPGPSVYSFPAKSAEMTGAAGYGRGGSVYVVKGKASSVSTPAWNVTERISSKPMRVVKEIPSSVTSQQLGKIVRRSVARDRAVRAVGRAAGATGVVGGATAVNKRRGSSSRKK